MLQKILAVILTMTFLVSGVEHSPDKPVVKKLKPVAIADGFALGGISGTISRRAELDIIVFCPDETLTDNIGSIEEGRGIEIVESFSLDIIEKALADDKSLKVKVWGLITEFERDNYAYINYLMPVVEVPLTEEQSVEDVDDTDSAEVSKDEDIIPEDIISKLRTSNGSPDAGNFEAFEGQKKDEIYADNTGFIGFDQDGRAYFTPDGLGLNIQSRKYYFQKCRVLQKVLSKIGDGLQDTRFSVAGVASEYKGEKYLLLQRAVRSYSYGNLSDF